MPKRNREKCNWAKKTRKGRMLRERNGKWTKTISKWYPRDGKKNKGRQTKLGRMEREQGKWTFVEEAYAEGQAGKQYRSMVALKN
ncbi:hypothetical protein EVAR_30545_1 [Eumeta japonica]|uniref:Uncharacterized protein n=1 Tax=Eumeta variegata TaxID=151549 RepID=A0A4C1VQ65_EUMVA|nr:hypothetical protein EVAR_30545_1 [Eumeta japonica]